MGGTSYNFDARSVRSISYRSKGLDDNFEQNKLRRIHESMDPKTALVRESRDNEHHPEALPIIIGLDVTGSMGYIPQAMIKDGLPTLISYLTERKFDPAVMFMGIGDSRNDKAPLQVGQFEGSDKEMDVWLERTWLEGNGGGNHGESYAWAWYFAATRCVTDHWDKRGEKGFIFTIGNEPCHGITSSEFMEVLGINKVSCSNKELYNMACDRWNVYHLEVTDNGSEKGDWSFMGERFITVPNHKDIPKVIADIIAANAKPITETKSDVPGTTSEEFKITL